MTSRPCDPVTAEQIARQLKLSRTTVSLVLNGRAESHRISPKTATRVLAAAKAVNYHPNIIARQLAGKRSNAIGVLISTAAIADPRLIQMMEMFAAEKELRFIIGHAVGTTGRITAYLEDFRARGVDGIISIFHNHPDYRSIVLPALAGFGNVVFYEKPEFEPGGQNPAPCYVEPDFYEVGRLGVRHLIERGCERIGLVLNNLTFSYALHRHRAYCDVLAEAGRPVDQKLVWTMDQRASVPWTASFTAELAAAAVEDLVINQGVDGIVAVNDSYAARLVAALRKRGLRVPDDVAIVGCDDLETATLIDPPLTTIDLGLEDLARAQVEMMCRILDEGIPPSDQRAVVIRPRLVARESS